LKSKTSLDDVELQKIISQFNVVHAKRNQLLLSVDDICDKYYFINKGCIRLYTISSDGKENSRYFAFEENFATALPSFIDQKPAGEYLQTIQNSELLYISRTKFYHLVDTIPEFAKLYTGILENGFIVAQKRIYGFQGFNAQEKVKWIIKNQPKLLLNVSNKMAASYLGISASTLSRIKSKI